MESYGKLCQKAQLEMQSEFYCDGKEYQYITSESSVEKKQSLFEFLDRTSLDSFHLKNDYHNVDFNCQLLEKIASIGTIKKFVFDGGYGAITTVKEFSALAKVITSCPLESLSFEFIAFDSLQFVDNADLSILTPALQSASKLTDLTLYDYGKCQDPKAFIDSIMAIPNLKYFNLQTELGNPDEQISYLVTLLKENPKLDQFKYFDFYGMEWRFQLTESIADQLFDAGYSVAFGRDINDGVEIVCTKSSNPTKPDFDP